MAADVAEAAGSALRAAGDADGAAVVYEAVAEVIAFFGRNDLPQFALHFRGFFDVVNEADQVAQADAVGIGDDSGFAEDIAHNEVSALSTDTGQSQEFIEGLRHMVIILLVKNSHAGTDVACLASPESAWTDDLFNLLRFRCCECRNVGKFFVQKRCDLVDAGVGTLSREADTHQELPGLFVVQCALRNGVFLLEPFNHLQGEFLTELLIFCECGFFSCHFLFPCRGFPDGHTCLLSCRLYSCCPLF